MKRCCSICEFTGEGGNGRSITSTSCVTRFSFNAAAREDEGGLLLYTAKAKSFKHHAAVPATSIPSIVASKHLSNKYPLMGLTKLKQYYRFLVRSTTPSPVSPPLFVS